MIPKKALLDNTLSGLDFRIILALDSLGGRGSKLEVLDAISAEDRAVRKRIPFLVRDGYLTVEREMTEANSNLPVVYILQDPEVTIVTPSPVTFVVPDDLDMKKIARRLSDNDMTGHSRERSGRRLANVASELVEKPGWSLEMLDNLYKRPTGMWYRRDFRGKRGDSPTPEQVATTWVAMHEAWQKEHIPQSVPENFTVVNGGLSYRIENGVKIYE